MDDERVDIVDKNDVVIARMPKREAHEKGLLHRCVIAEVIENTFPPWAVMCAPVNRSKTR